MPLNVRGSDSLYFKTGIDVTGLQTGAAKAKGIIAGLASSITKMDVFAAIGISSVLVFRKMAKASYEFARDFEHSMTEVSTISKMVADNFEGMSQKVLNMSKRFPEDAIILSRALYQIASAGYAGAESFEILEQSTKLATASVTDTFVAADALTSIMNAYGKEAGNVTNISDDLFTIVRLGKTTMRELGPEITTITGLAAQAGIEWKELSAIIAESVKTLPTPIAIHGIRSMLAALFTEPTDKAKDLVKYLKTIGFEFSLEAAKSKGFVKFMQDLNKATDGNIKTLELLFPNIRGLTGLMSIMRDEGNKLSDTFKEFNNDLNATNDAFNKMMTSTENRSKIFRNNMKQIFYPIGRLIADYVNAEVGGINKILDKIDVMKLESIRKQLQTRATGALGGETGTIEEFFGATSRAFKESPAGTTIDVEKRLKEIQKTFADLGIEINGLDYRFRALHTATGEARWKILKALIDDVTESMENLGKETDTFVGPPLPPGYKEPTTGGGKGFEIHPENKGVFASLFGGTQLFEMKAGSKAMQKDIDERTAILKKAMDETAALEEKQRAKEAAIQHVELEDYRNLNKEKLADYRKRIEAELKLDTISNERRVQLEYELRDVIKEQFDDRIKQISEIGDVFRALGGLIEQFDAKLGGMISGVSDITSAITQMKNETTGWGTFAGGIGILSTYVNLMKSLTTSTGPTSQEKTLAALGKLNKSIEKNTEVLRRSIGQDVYDDLLAVYKAWEEKREADLQAIRDIKTWNKIGQYTGKTLGDIFTDKQLLNLTLGSDVLKADKELYTTLIKDMSDAEAKMYDYAKEYKELLTGTTTESIADSITEGFMQGKTAIENFTDTFENLMRKAILNTFKAKILSEALIPWYETFAEMAKGGLDPDEIFILGRTLKDDFVWMADIFSGLDDILKEAGMDFTLARTTGEVTKTGLAGAIAGVSEETAGLLAGQFNALLFNTIQLKNSLINDTNRHLAAISLKDSDIANKLNEMMITGWTVKGLTTDNKIHLANIDWILHQNYIFGNRLTAINDRIIETRDTLKLTNSNTSDSKIHLSNIDWILGQNYVFGNQLVKINDSILQNFNATSTIKDYTSVIMQTAIDNLKANQESAINSRHLANIEAYLAPGIPTFGPTRAIGA